MKVVPQWGVALLSGAGAVLKTYAHLLKALSTTAHPPSPSDKL